ncbi:DUF6153 family protein [Saccharopolyspora rhizosphaerae]|uniref:DUF6153 family protein n=1 Tax=Saccharopolyspora rhizosphaerae TaxID=2492662 RepID=UPI0026CE2C04
MRSRIVRWGLLIALALGVVLMHHTPGPHASTNPEAHTSAVSAAPITAASDESCECHHPGEHSGVPFPSGHEVLHLCLAVVIGFAASVVLAFRRRWGAVVAGRVRSLAPPGVRGRPPAPTARRLAVLCVMRC